MIRHIVMNTLSIYDIVCSEVCLAFSVTAVVCAVVRWFHMCRPYDREEKYFYPARRMVSFFYFVVAFLNVPYVLNPGSAGVLDYMRILGIVFYPTCFVLLFLRYFRWKKLKTKLDWILFFLLMALQTVLCVIALICPSWIEDNMVCLSVLCGIISMALSVRLFSVLRWVYGRIEEYHHQNFSSDCDFPYRFAERAMWMTAVWILIVWLVFLTGSRNMKIVSDIVLSVGMVGFLCAILYPQRMLQPKSVGDVVELMEKDEAKKMEDAVVSIEEDEQDQPVQEQVEPVCDEEARRQVIEIILRRYKEQHLQKKDVLSEVDKGKIAPASRFIASVGYYNLINMFRLEYARQYAEANPSAKQATVAEASGFASGPSFSKAKKSVKVIDSEIVAGVHL